MDRLEKLEKIVNRIVKRVRSTTTTVVTPHLISGYSEGYGELFNRMLFQGKITKALICFNKRPKNPICIEVKVLNSEIGFTKSYYVSKIKASVDLDLTTVDGSIISVNVYSTVEETEADMIKQVWLSILWQPSLSSANVKSYLIDSLEAAGEEFLIKE